MPTTEYIPVKYLRNADARATGAIRFNDDDRDDIEIGGTGVVTEEERTNLAANGIVLDVLEGDEAKAALAEAKTPEPEVALRDRSLEELKDLAEEEGVDTSGLRSKDDYATAIEEKRANLQEGVESLPATATRPAGVVTGPGAGGAAGPGGAAAAPGASGGGPAT